LHTESLGALYSDTDPKIEALQIQLWRQASPTKKMHMVAQLNAAARLLAMTGLRSQSHKNAHMSCITGWPFCYLGMSWPERFMEQRGMENKPDDRIGLQEFKSLD
jgi:hypothetical protein